jgi:hypothetical protein
LKRKLAVGMVLGDFGEAGIGRPQQFVLEGQHGAAEAHHGQPAPAVMPSSQCSWNRTFLNMEGGPGRLPPASCATANEN